MAETKEIGPLAPRSVVLQAALDHIMSARELLEEALTGLTEEQRGHLLPAPAEIGSLSTKVMQAASTKKGLDELCPAYDPDLITEQLAKVNELAPLANQLVYLGRLVGDDRNGSLAEAYGSLLALYRLAKVLEEGDTTWSPIVKPFTDLFAQRRSKKE